MQLSAQNAEISRPGSETDHASSSSPAISNDSSSVASISASISVTVSASRSASGSDSEPAAKKTKQCVPSAGADVVAPLGTSTMPPLWLGQGDVLRIVDALKKRPQGGDTARSLNFYTNIFCTAA
uniref:Uncharacterized protein n=1 Tax=Eutreptiella gymnastica TaxID=73025 RepID=A0A7S4G0R2_9EUGL